MISAPSRTRVLADVLLFYFFLFQAMDALYFMFIFFVFIVAYGVARHVILNRDETRALITPVKVTMVPYFQLFGELFLDFPKETRNSFSKVEF